MSIPPSQPAENVTFDSLRTESRPAVHKASSRMLPISTSLRLVQPQARHENQRETDTRTLTSCKRTSK